MSRAKRRADRLREAIPIQRLLSDYGYRVDPNYDGEQQFSCDFHGDGHDNKPSARVYPVSKSTYCFSCDVSRDVIQVTREKEGLGFWGAIRLLERRYGLPALAEDPEDEGPEKGLIHQIDAIIDSSKTWEDELHRVETFLLHVTKEKTLELQETLRFWEAFDKVQYKVKKQEVSEATGKEALQKILGIALQAVQEAFA